MEPYNPAPPPPRDPLLKKAQHAKTNLVALAVLVFMAAILLGFVLTMSGEKSNALMAAGPAVMGIAYIVLSRAARHGDPRSVAVPMIFIAVMIAINLAVDAIVSSNAPARPTTSPCASVGIPLLMLVSLWQSRKVLMDLKARGLWEQAFPDARPTGKFIAVGSILLVGGFLLMIVGSGLGMNFSKEGKLAREFVGMIEGEDQRLLACFRSLSIPPSGNAMTATETALAALNQRLARIEAEAKGSKAMEEILARYRRAVDLWDRAIKAIGHGATAPETINEWLAEADRERKGALELYDKTYAGRP